MGGNFEGSSWLGGKFEPGRLWAAKGLMGLIWAAVETDKAAPLVRMARWPGGCQVPLPLLMVCWLLRLPEAAWPGRAHPSRLVALIQRAALLAAV